MPVLLLFHHHFGPSPVLKRAVPPCPSVDGRSAALRPAWGCATHETRRFAQPGPSRTAATAAPRRAPARAPEQAGRRGRVAGHSYSQPGGGAAGRTPSHNRRPGAEPQGGAEARGARPRAGRAPGRRRCGARPGHVMRAGPSSPPAALAAGALPPRLEAASPRSGAAGGEPPPRGRAGSTWPRAHEACGTSALPGPARAVQPRGRPPARHLAGPARAPARQGRVPAAPSQPRPSPLPAAPCPDNGIRAARRRRPTFSSRLAPLSGRGSAGKAAGSLASSAEGRAGREGGSRLLP